MTVRYGDNCIHHHKLHEWVRRFEEEGKSGADTHFSRAPTICFEAMKWTDKDSKDNRRIGSNNSTSATGMDCKSEWLYND
jgi:hypothetical protein